jgi:hypothetical protein
MAFAYDYQLMTKSAIISYLTNKVNNDVARRKIDPAIVPVDYVVRILLEDVALGYADSTINKKCSKLLTIISN